MTGGEGRTEGQGQEDGMAEGQENMAGQKGKDGKTRMAEGQDNMAGLKGKDRKTGWQNDRTEIQDRNPGPKSRTERDIAIQPEVTVRVHCGYRQTDDHCPRPTAGLSARYRPMGAPWWRL